MILRTATLFTLISISCLFGQSEERETPAWMKNITRIPPGEYADLRAVHLEYTLGWNNKVNAGRFKISINRTKSKNEKFVGEATGGSTGFARALWPYDFRARSVIDTESLRPITFQLSEREKDQANSYDIIFEEKRQIYNTRTQKDGEEMKSGMSRFRFDYGQDVLSAAFYLRSQPLKVGDEIAMVVTPFNKPYLSYFKVIGREKRKIKGKTHNTIKLDAKIAKINGDRTIKSYDKIKEATLWIEDDNYRLPLELQTDITIGFVSARLDEKKWLE